MSDRRVVTIDTARDFCAEQLGKSQRPLYPNEISRWANIAPDVTRHALAAMVKAGNIIEVNTGRGTAYQYPTKAREPAASESQSDAQAAEDAEPTAPALTVPDLHLLQHRPLSDAEFAVEMLRMMSEATRMLAKLASDQAEVTARAVLEQQRLKAAVSRKQRVLDWVRAQQPIGPDALRAENDALKLRVAELERKADQAHQDSGADDLRAGMNEARTMLKQHGFDGPLMAALKAALEQGAHFERMYSREKAICDQTRRGAGLLPQGGAVEPGAVQI